jgi:hypothetical protein
MKYMIPILLIVLAGCSTTENDTTEKTYSEDTNRAFLEIERGGSYYAKKRERSIAPPQVRVVTQKKTLPKKSIRDIQKEPSESTEPEIQIATLTGPNQERLAEINQNLAFYCMKHRKSKAFGGDEKKCMNFVNETLNNCQKSNKKADAKLLLCLNKKLKRRP